MEIRPRSILRNLSVFWEDSCGARHRPVGGPGGVWAQGWDPCLPGALPCSCPGQGWPQQAWGRFPWFCPLLQLWGSGRRQCGPPTNHVGCLLLVSASGSQAPIWAHLEPFLFLPRSSPTPLPFSLHQTKCPGRLSQTHALSLPHRPSAAPHPRPSPRKWLPQAPWDKLAEAG